MAAAPTILKFCSTLGSGGGLWRSTSAGTSWATVSGVTKVTAVTFGKSSSGSGYSVFVSGYKSGVFGIYRSDDDGSTWIPLTNPTLEPVSALSGDRQNFGKVYLGTSGRGIFVGQ